ncbi:unnamed protein product [Protopolystoma xenopodis]|uniref:Uncharacterized protein n=1 Tax=Protopolystoma xenopodis TaxID=117903 RepID=A0A448XJP5_9PLAT|nr:unnamed protein product [Protopolystoma xenopodis]
MLVDQSGQVRGAFEWQQLKSIRAVENDSLAAPNKRSFKSTLTWLDLTGPQFQRRSIVYSVKLVGGVNDDDVVDDEDKNDDDSSGKCPGAPGKSAWDGSSFMTSFADWRKRSDQWPGCICSGNLCDGSTRHRIPPIPAFSTEPHFCQRLDQFSGCLHSRFLNDGLERTPLVFCSSLSSSTASTASSSCLQVLGFLPGRLHLDPAATTHS